MFLSHRRSGPASEMCADHGPFVMRYLGEGVDSLQYHIVLSPAALSRVSVVALCNINSAKDRLVPRRVRVNHSNRKIGH